ncbi:hypothetical protein L9F63_001172, partial [Diploptera punctata]
HSIFLWRQRLGKNKTQMADKKFLLGRGGVTKQFNVMLYIDAVVDIDLSSTSQNFSHEHFKLTRMKSTNARKPYYTDRVDSGENHSMLSDNSGVNAEFQSLSPSLCHSLCTQVYCPPPTSLALKGMW